MRLSDRLRQLLAQTRDPDDEVAAVAALKFFRLARDKGVALVVSVEEGKDHELLEAPGGGDTRVSPQPGPVGPSPDPEPGSVEHALAEFASQFPGGVLPPSGARG